MQTSQKAGDLNTGCPTKVVVTHFKILSPVEENSRISDPEPKPGDIQNIAELPRLKIQELSTKFSQQRSD